MGILEDIAALICVTTIKESFLLRLSFIMLKCTCMGDFSRQDNLDL